MMAETLSAKDLLIGVGTDLYIRIDGVEVRMKSTLVGIKPEEYLIIESPKVVGIETKLYSGNGIGAVFMYNGTVYGFKATILNSIKNPMRLTFISYPKSCEQRDLRQHKRVDTYFPGTVKLSVDDTEYKGVIVDISPGGCKFTCTSVSSVSRHLVQPEEVIHLLCVLPGVEGTVALTGKIMGINQDSKKISMGIRFEGVSEEMTKKIESYVTSVLEYLS